jgi:dTDP-4-dehydrorhamnose 3,5-epimerase
MAGRKHLTPDERIKLPLNKRTKRYIHKTSIEGLYKITRETDEDIRGNFREVFHLDELSKELGYEINFVQMNHSISKSKVIRGFHPDTWDKLVYPLTGEALIAIADINPLSPTFRKVEYFKSDPENRFALFVAKGLGNSLCVLSEEPVHYLFLVTDYWDGEISSGNRAVNLFDQDLNVDWPIKDPVISEKDRKNKTLRELFLDKHPKAFKKNGKK